MTTNDRANETLFLRLASSLGGGRSLMQAAVVLLVVMTTWQLQVAVARRLCAVVVGQKRQKLPVKSS